MKSAIVNTEMSVSTNVEIGHFNEEVIGRSSSNLALLLTLPMTPTAWNLGRYGHNWMSLDNSLTSILRASSPAIEDHRNYFFGFPVSRC
jgi:hypothetical protein